MSKYGDIAEVLYSYYQRLIVEYPEEALVGVWLFGSQNYGMDGPDSDIDAKAIYVPSIEQMVNLKEPVSRIIETPTGNIEVKDVRSMWKMWKKQNINFLEILYTDFYLTNAGYTDKWEEVLRIADRISQYNPVYTFNSIRGQTLNTLKYQEITGKKVANAARFIDFLRKYSQEIDYRTCIKVSPAFKEKWLPIKLANEVIYKNDPMVIELLENLEEIYIEGFERWKNFSPKNSHNEITDAFMTKWMISLVEKRTKNLTF